MSNFLEKLKRGMNAEIDKNTEEGPEKKVEETKEIKETEEEKKGKSKQAKITEKPKEISEEGDLPEIKIEKIKIQTPTIPDKKESFLEKQKWSFKEKGEGQLAVDVYQTEKDLVVCSAIAGVKPEDIDITIEKDILTIRGRREKLTRKEHNDYFVQECFWGSFLKEVILPVEIDPGRTTAEMKDGILTIKMPKIFREDKKKIEIKN